MQNGYEIFVYADAEGWEPYTDWLDALPARETLEVQRRVQRARSGNFGDHKSLGGGLFEMRIDYGPGYRIYYCFEGRYLVLLLSGGDKRKQAADIKTSRALKTDFERREP